MTDKDTRLLFEQYIVSENREDNIRRLMSIQDDIRLKEQLHAKFKKMFEEIADIRAFVRANEDKFPHILDELYSMGYDNIKNETDRELSMYIIGLSEDLEYIGEEISSSLGYEV